MKQIYTKFGFLVATLLFVVQCVIAQSTLISKELTYGDWMGATTEHLPTLITTNYYDADGRKAAVFSGRLQLGDSETTPEVEQEGDIRPETFSIYEYSKTGKLLNVYLRKYRAIYGKYSGWDEASIVEWYKYDEKDRPIKGKKDSDNFTYEWSGDTLVAETDTTDRGTWEYTKRYSDFVPGTKDCPRRTFQTGKYNNYIIDNEYDAKNRLVCRMTYKIANPVKNEVGAIISGEKGLPYMKQVWTYDAFGELLSEVTSYWNNGKETFEENTKQEYVWSEEDGGVMVTAYQNSLGKWVRFGYPKAYVESVYQKTTVLEDLSLKVMEGEANTAMLSFYLPDAVEDATPWEVYRNGEYIGDTQMSAGKMVYIDSEVMNGKWTYFVKAKPQANGKEAYISNMVEVEFNTELPAVTKVSTVASGRYDEGYAYHLVWDAPETNLTIKGYNVILNPKAGNSNPPVQNETLITAPTYLLQIGNAEQLDNNIIIETVYNVGFKKSEPMVFTLDTENTVTMDYQERLKAVYTYGDMMGESDANTPTKVETYYYDCNMNLSRVLTEGYLTGDDPDTPEVEEKGDKLPVSYLMYYYDEEGRLTEVKEKKYGLYSGYDKVWSNEIKTLQAFTYDEEGRVLTELSDGTYLFEYTWDGDNKVREVKKSQSGTTVKDLYYMTYSNFVQDKVNLPQYAIKVAASANLPANNRIYEMEYNALGNLCKRTEYKHGTNVEKDENGNIISADKGQISIQEIWTYQGENLVEYEKHTWKSAANALVPSSKTIYTPTARGVMMQSYSYTSVAGTEGWTKSAVRTEYVNGYYYKDSNPQTLAVKELTDSVNSINLASKSALTTYTSEPVYEVYRNGQLIGVAEKKVGKFQFDDYVVQNGHWDYFIKVKSFADGIDFYTTNVVEQEFNTPLPAAQNILFPVNGKDDEGNYTLTVTWETPETDLQIKGYNIFTDIKSYTKNPSPENGLMLISPDTCQYNFVWQDVLRTDKTVCVEVVYNIGKVKTDNIPVTLSTLPLAVHSVNQNAAWIFQNDVLTINADVLQIQVFAVNGTLVGEATNTSCISLAHLPKGVYLVSAKTSCGVETRKIVRQ